jgi:SAM-dependent methyltransferase
MSFSNYCPICRSQLQSFLPFGVNRRLNALCPVCRSLERHRLIWLFLKKAGVLFGPPKKRMLHVAPEACLSKLFQCSEHIEYISADLDRLAMINLDLCNISFPDEAFNVIIASHVLEHIPDDRKAMRELYRVLKRSGWAILQVPIKTEVTYEDSTIVAPSERERVFGQSDHVRIYGQDYYERLREAGFIVHRKKVLEQLDQSTARKYGIFQDEEITFCIK